MSPHVRSRVLLSLSLLLLIVPLTTFAATENHETIGRMTANAAGLSFQVGSDNESVTLTISGPNNFQYSHQFPSARSISLKLRDVGATLPDGSYTYEMRLAPRVSDSVRAQIAAARESGDDAALERIRTDAGLREIPAQSGAFTVMSGSLISSDATEPSSPSGPKPVVALSNSGTATAQLHNAPVKALDVVTADDAIIQGSACIGLDCVVNESFGFDTIRMKENNTRIKFDDTSTSTGFPNHDWQLTANDSASGGANKFSIEDITASTVPMTITGSAPTNSIFVDSTGRLGLRTSTPVLDVHISTSNTPAIRQEQTSAGGFTAQTWDIGANEANWFVRDVTGGSRLPLRIRPGAPTSSIDIAASGSVGIGTASPESKLHVFGDNTADTFVGIGPNPDGSPGTESGVTFGYSGSSFGRGSGFINVRPDSGATAPNPSLRLAANNTVRVLIDNNGEIGLGTIASTGANPDAPIHWSNGVNTARLSAVGVWESSSSRKAKEHIENLTSEAAFQVLKELQPVTYNYKVLPSYGKVGFIAEDVPDLVATPTRDSLSALDIVAVVTKVVQEQQKTIDQLNARIAEIEKEKHQQK
jgi:hypothetical protein